MASLVVVGSTPVSSDLEIPVTLSPGSVPLTHSSPPVVASCPDAGESSAISPPAATSTSDSGHLSASLPIVLPPQICSTSSLPEKVPSVNVPSYAERFKASLRNLKKISSPILEEDGIPIVQAPQSVLLQTATMWKGHIIAQFHGLLPPTGKIFSDLNPAWGKYGHIKIRTLSDTSCLIFIPCVSTREWVLQVGYWQAGNCAFNVFPWSTDGLAELSDLESAPTWAVLKNVPPQMYSLDGISVIASAIGEPLHTEKSRLDPYHFGDTKVKVEISLDSSPPTTVIVRDSLGHSVRVEVSYPRLPPKCCNCGRFGHLLNRCPKPLMKKQPKKPPAQPFAAAGIASIDSKIPLAAVKGPTISADMRAAIRALPQAPVIKGSDASTHQVKQRVRVRSRSRGRGRSAPHVEDPVQVGSVVVEPLVLKVDHRVVTDGVKEVVVPRSHSTHVSSISKEDHSASGLKKVGSSVKSGSSSLGAGSLFKKTVFAEPKKKGRQKFVPVQELVNVASVPPILISKGSSVPTQGVSLGSGSIL